MSWFGRSFSVTGSSRRREEEEEEEEEEVEEERVREPEDEKGRRKVADFGGITSPRGKGVKEDLTQLTKTFTRQLWGVASFLAPLPPEKVDHDASAWEEFSVEQEDGRDSRSSGAGAAVDSFEGGEENAQGRALKLDTSPAQTDPEVGECSPRGDEGGLKGGVSGRPRFIGIKSDFAELRGSVATGFSRISSSVIRAVAGEESGNDADDDEELLDRSASYNPVGDTDPLVLPVDENSRPGKLRLDSFLKPLLANILAKESLRQGDQVLVEDEELFHKDVSSLRTTPERNSNPKEGEFLTSAIKSRLDEISKFASSLLPFVQDTEEEQEGEGTDEEIHAVGVTEAVVIYARNIAMHPETWLDFPLTEDEQISDFEMTKYHKEHVKAIEHAAPGLGALRIELCPQYMSEARFWKIYFVLLHSRLNPDDAQFLSTFQVVSAREQLLLELLKPERQSGEADTSHIIELTEEEEVTEELVYHTAGGQAEKEVAAVVLRGLLTDELEMETSGSSPTHQVRQSIDVADEVRVEAMDDSSKTFVFPMAGTTQTGTFPSLTMDDDEAEVDEWLEDEPSSSECRGTVAHRHVNIDEDVSFSDLEEEEPSSERSGGSKSKDITAICASDGSKSGTETTASALEGKLGNCKALSRSVGAHGKSVERGEFNDWLTVDQEDVHSADSSSP